MRSLYEDSVYTWSDTQTLPITRVEQHALKCICGGPGSGNDKGDDDCGEVVIGVMEEEEDTW